MLNVELGRIILSDGVAERIQADIEFLKFTSYCFGRYVNCDWGEVDDEDARINDEAFARGGKILQAVYQHFSHHDDERDWCIWIITEADKSATNIKLPNEC